MPDVEDFEQMIHKSFKVFKKQFLNITSLIYQQYSAVEEYSKQTEKIVHLYINHFIEKNRSVISSPIGSFPNIYCDLSL